MTEPIKTTRLKPQAIAAIRATAEPARIGDAFRELLPEVHAHLEGAGITPSGPPLARFFDYAEDEADFEAGYPVPEPVSGDDRVVASELPGGLAAVTTHVGPHEGLQDVHEAIGEWVLAHGHDPSGPVWEVYVRGPVDEEDSSGWRTEVVWPLRK